ncbi:tetratricopeptide repeat protein [Myxacorys almedinensis A]|uniref:Tetratricopeptide repeat protein n=1 Tax=Myxacorys almedinensis A TaxID=2690445 RepID=A0A8J7Z3Y9_9CYAN|nr:tetratricopeptide repeat protein [Myxacorys almedinensis A]
MNISFCIIVKDEEERLLRCLESVRGVVNETIVVDTGSCDRTIDIARSYGASVYSFEWCNDFSAARNASLHYAQGDWVLVLDADEVLVPDIVPALKQVVESEQYLVINLLRHEVGASQSPYSMLSRLFRRHPDIAFTRPYHAMIDDRVAELLQREPNWRVGHLPEVAILHEGYRSDVIAARDKFNKARITMEGFLETHPHDPYVCSKLGALYVQIGQVETGLELLRRGLRAIHSNANEYPLSNALHDASTLYELHYHLGSVYAELHHFNQAEQHYQAAMQQPIPARLKLGAINNLGNILKDKGDLQNAVALYQQALQIDPTFSVGYYNLGMTLKAMGRLTDAIAQYKRAIALNPNYAEAHQNLGVALLKAGQVAESLEAFQSAIARYQQQGLPAGEQLKQSLQDMGFRV